MKNFKFFISLLVLVHFQTSAQAPTPTKPLTPPTEAAPLSIKQTTPSSPHPPAAQIEAAPALNDETKSKVKETRRLKKTFALFEIEIDGQPTGKIKALLFPDKAPETVENFTALAEGRKQFKEYDEKKGKLGSLTLRPFYDGLIFHRIAPDLVIQGGCPLGNGRGGPGYFINDEFNSELKHNGPGILAMANPGRPNTNGSQFYITLKELKHLDGKNTIFGKVIEGMDVVQKIGKIKSDRMTQVPLQKAVIKKVEILREYFN